MSDQRVGESGQTLAIPGDMIETLARAFAEEESELVGTETFRIEARHRETASTVLAAALAGRTVLEVPQPIQQNDRGATWAVTVDGNQTEFASGLHWDDNSPIVETDFALWDPTELKAYCLAGLAASDHALGLASESSGEAGDE